MKVPSVKRGCTLFVLVLINTNKPASFWVWAYSRGKIIFIDETLGATHSLGNF